jgi:hypothetical protein
MLRRALVLTAGAGLAAALGTPASANVIPGCQSTDNRCQYYDCPEGYRDLDIGASDTDGPWIVICVPE